MANQALQELGDSLLAALPGSAVKFEVVHNEGILWAEAAAIVKVMTTLRDDG